MRENEQWEEKLHNIIDNYIKSRWRVGLCAWELTKIIIKEDKNACRKIKSNKRQRNMQEMS